MTMNSASNGMPAGFDAGRVRAHVAEARANATELRAQWPKLLSEHEGDWVASHQGKFVFGRTVQDAVDAAKREGWPLDVIAVDRVDRERPRTLL